MQVTETFSDGLKRAYTVVVPAAEIESRRMARLTALGRDLRLPGFRPGKVPLPLVRQRYGTAVSAEVLDQSINDATQKVVADRQLRPAMQPKVDLVSPGADEAVAATATDIEIKVELELLPEIEIPDLKSLTLTRPKAEVAPEAIDRALAEIAKRNRELIEVTEDRGAVEGDVVTVDYEGKVDDVAFPGGTGTGMDVEIGGSGFIPGFAEQMVGIRPGEERVLNVTFPEAYGEKTLAGKAAVFTVTARRLRQTQPPTFDDGFAVHLGFENIADLRDAVRQQLQREYDNLARLKVKRELLDALAERASFATPDGMVDAEFGQIWQRVMADRGAGQGDAEDAGKDDSVLQAEYRGIAQRRVRLGLLLAEIGRAAGVTVQPDEMARAARAEAARYPGQEAQVMKFFRENQQAMETLRGPIYEDKVVDYVLELAQVTDLLVSAEELAKAPDEAAGANAAEAPADQEAIAAPPAEADAPDPALEQPSQA
jgi:trigger factor